MAARYRDSGADITIVFKRAIVQMIAMLVGLITGTIIMFSSTIYKTIYETGSALEGGRVIYINPGPGQETVLAPILSNVKWNIGRIYNNKPYAQIAELVLVTIILFAVLLKNRNKTEKIQKILPAGMVIINVMVLTDSVLYLLGLGGWQAATMDAQPWIAAIVTLMLVLLELVMLFLWTRDTRFLYASYIWLSALLVYIPMAATNTTGMRLLLPSFMMNIIFVAKLSGIAIEQFKDSKCKKIVLTGIVALLVLMSMSPTIRFIRDYTQIRKTTAEQLEIIEEAKESDEKEIILPSYDYDLEEGYLWMPHSQANKGGFKTFYGLSQDVVISYK